METHAKFGYQVIDCRAPKWKQPSNTCSHLWFPAGSTFPSIRGYQVTGCSVALFPSWSIHPFTSNCSPLLSGCEAVFFFWWMFNHQNTAPARWLRLCWLRSDLIQLVVIQFYSAKPCNTNFRPKWTVCWRPNCYQFIKHQLKWNFPSSQVFKWLQPPSSYAKNTKVILERFKKTPPPVLKWCNHPTGVFLMHPPIQQLA